MYRLTSLPILLALLVGAPAATDPEPTTTWTVGSAAPHVHLPDIESGRALDLVSLRGKKVLLIEFASW